MREVLKWLSLRVSKKSGFSFFGFTVAVLGVVVAVAALIIVNAVMTGFQSAVKKRLLASNADILVMKTTSLSNFRLLLKEIKDTKHVKAVEPFLYIPAMVSTDFNATSGASVRGCVPNEEKKTTDIPQKLISGSWEKFSEDPDGAVVGKTLAENLGVSVGDRITLIFPKGKVTPFGFMPSVYHFKVDGIFWVGMYQFDSQLILTHLKTLQSALGTADITGFMVKVDDISHVKLVEESLKRKLGDSFLVTDWISMNKSLFSALKLEKLAMLLILVLIAVVASFNISSLLMMNVSAKKKDIAILKTLGAQDGLVVKIFVLQGAFIGLLGTFFGEIIGITVSLLGEHYKLIRLPPDVYYIDHLPFKLHPADCIMAAVIALSVSVVATLYPALKASKTDPVKVLREGGT